MLRRHFLCFLLYYTSFLLTHDLTYLLPQTPSFLCGLVKLYLRISFPFVFTYAYTLYSIEYD